MYDWQPFLRLSGLRTTLWEGLDERYGLRTKQGLCTACSKGLEVGHRLGFSAVICWALLERVLNVASMRGTSGALAP